MIYVMFETKNEIDLSVMIEQSNSGVELKNEACIVWMFMFDLISMESS
jgi:hypothetical protein